MKRMKLVLGILLFAAGMSFAADHRPIGVFDSGTGGLTVLEKMLTDDFAHEKFVYLGDQANMPYGDYAAAGKSEFLRGLVIKDAEFLLGKNAKIVVIACNTATAYGYDAVANLLARRADGTKVIGVVNAGARSVIRQLDLANRPEPCAIGVMATPGTIASGVYERTIKSELGKLGVTCEVRVFSRGCAGLADAVEAGSKTAPTIACDNLRALMAEHRAKAPNLPLRAVILGCTHFPFVQRELESVAPKGLIFVDPAVDTAAECAATLKEQDRRTDATTPMSVETYVSVAAPGLDPSKLDGKGGLTRAWKYGRTDAASDRSTVPVPIREATGGDPLRFIPFAHMIPRVRNFLADGKSALPARRFEPYRVKGLEPRPDFWKVRPEEVSALCARATKCSRKEVICHTPLGYPVHALFYGDFGEAAPQTTWPAGESSTTWRNYYGNRTDGKQTFLFIAGIHGAEPENVAAAVNLIQMLETGRDFRGETDARLLDLVSKYRFIVVPCVNMDGRSISPDHLRGVDWDTFRRVSQGVWKADDSRIGWRGSKSWFPLPLDKVAYPGGYPNANGYNINLDCAPGDIRTEEAKALLRLAARWRVDCSLNGHSYEFAPTVLQSSAIDYEARRQRKDDLRFRCNRALVGAGLLPSARLPPKGQFPTHALLNLDSALEMVCGGLALCLECSVSYDTPDDPPNRKPARTYTFGELMQPAFVVIRELLAAGLEKPFVCRGGDRVLGD